MTLAGRVALVTGASRGIGAVIARVLAEQGMAVALNARSEDVNAVAGDLRQRGLRVAAYQADVSRKPQVEAMLQQVEAGLGPLYLLVNNAGLLRTGPTPDLSEEDWDATFDVDVKGVFLCSQAAIRRMIPRREGRIVNVASIAGHIVRVEQIAYCSAKAAVIHFSRCLAVEMAPHNITVNCLCPGMTRTDMLLEGAVRRGMNLDAMIAGIPHGRMAEPEEHAHLIAYFASDEAAHVTGQVVSVDGGQSQFLPQQAARPR
jgi:NAD(P)-dependent dehydrogenase (short-subunit alcohol dehydrogenase family)